MLVLGLRVWLRGRKCRFNGGWLSELAAMHGSAGLMGCRGVVRGGSVCWDEVWELL